MLDDYLVMSRCWLFLEFLGMDFLRSGLARLSFPGFLAWQERL